jgi:anti-sigma regulatory factor (Ser/Thr protein kinase)/pimeloyl-ACP methyl ester carboxylesterase
MADDTDLQTKLNVGVALIHGFWSSPSTWDPLVASLQSDPALEGATYYRFGYSSPKWRWPLSAVRIPDYDDIARTFANYVDVKLATASRVAIVTHSQGGLILQRFLVYMLSEGRGADLARIGLIVMLACPNSGSEYLRSIRRVARFGRHPQARELKVLNSNATEATRIVIRQIVNARQVTERTCPIPVRVFAGDADNIVTRAAAVNTFPDASVLPGDHTSILNPHAPNSLTHPTVKKLLLEFLGKPRWNVASVEDTPVTGSVHPRTAGGLAPLDRAGSLPATAAETNNSGDRSYESWHDDLAAGLLAIQLDADDSRQFYTLLNVVQDVLQGKQFLPITIQRVQAILHELITNVARHVSNNNAQVTVELQEKYVRLVSITICDDGPGVGADTVEEYRQRLASGEPEHGLMMVLRMASTVRVGPDVVRSCIACNVYDPKPPQSILYQYDNVATVRVNFEYPRVFWLGRDQPYVEVWREEELPTFIDNITRAVEDGSRHVLDLYFGHLASANYLAIEVSGNSFHTEPRPGDLALLRAALEMYFYGHFSEGRVFLLTHDTAHFMRDRMSRWAEQWGIQSFESEAACRSWLAVHGS